MTVQIWHNGDQHTFTTEEWHNLVEKMEQQNKTYQEMSSDEFNNLIDEAKAAK